MAAVSRNDQIHTDCLVNTLVSDEYVVFSLQAAETSGHTAVSAGYTDGL